MPEPITTATVLAKAANAVKGDASTDNTSLLKRLIGPSVDEFAEALRRSVAYRTRNFGRIAARADAKSRNVEMNQVVSQRVAYAMLDEGSLCDDELMADYLGGVLAGSRSPNGRDDRAVSWCRIISGMSWLQVKAHFLLYREWADCLHGRFDINLGHQGRMQSTMDVDLLEFASLLVGDSGISPEDALQDSIVGLSDMGLIEDDYSFGPGPKATGGSSSFDQALRTQPSIRGLELYGWAQGLPGLQVAQFATKAAVFNTDPPIPRITKVAMIRLPAPNPTTNATVPEL